MSEEKKLIIAKKYARAFLNLFKDKLQIDQVYALEEVVIFLKKHEKLFFYIELSSMGNNVKVKSFKKLLDQFKLNDIFLNLIKLLIESHRLFLLPDILVYIAKMYKDFLNIVDFTIISSHELIDDEIKTIVTFLQKCTRKKIDYKLKVDKNLIAGLKIFSDTLGWDYSVAQQLKLMMQAGS